MWLVCTYGAADVPAAVVDVAGFSAGLFAVFSFEFMHPMVGRLCCVLVAVAARSTTPFFESFASLSLFLFFFFKKKRRERESSFHHKR
jgi:hypothetical protein